MKKIGVGFEEGRIISEPRNPIKRFEGLLFKKFLQNPSIVVFRPSSSTFLTINSKKEVIIFFVQKNRFKVIKTIPLSNDFIPIAFSPNRKNEIFLPISHQSSKTFHLGVYNHKNENIVSYMKEHHDSPIICVDYHPFDGSLALSASKQKIIIWNMVNFSAIKTLRFSTFGARFEMLKTSKMGFGKEKVLGSIAKVQFSSLGNSIFVCFEKSIIVLKIREDEKKKKLFEIEMELKIPLLMVDETVLYSFDSSMNECFLVASGHYNDIERTGSFVRKKNFIFLWDINPKKDDSERLIKVLQNNENFGSIRKIKFFSDERRVIFDTNKGHMYLVDLLTRNVLHKLNYATSKIVNFEVNYNVKHMVTLLDNGGVYFYDFHEFCEYFKKLNLGEGNFLQLKNASEALGYLSWPSKTNNFYTQSKMVLEKSKEYHESETTLLGEKESKFENPNRSLILPKGKGLGLIKLNFIEVKGLLLSKGRYPAKYRKLIWKFLLKLPQNKKQFSLLLSKEFNDKMARKTGIEANTNVMTTVGNNRVLNFSEKFFHLQTTNNSVFRRMTKLLSLLVHVSPVFGLSAFVPDMLFPFCKLFPYDSLTIFEVFLTFFLNWGHEFFTTHPNPPFDSKVFVMMESVLKEFDEDLYDHLTKKLKVNVRELFWSVLKDNFTLALSSNDWVYLFDHVVTLDLLFYFNFAVAYFIYFRNILKKMKTKRSCYEIVESLFDNALDIKLNLMIQMAISLGNGNTYNVNEYNKRTFLKEDKEYFSMFDKTVKYPITFINNFLKYNQRRRQILAEEKLFKTNRKKERVLDQIQVQKFFNSRVKNKERELPKEESVQFLANEQFNVSFVKKPKTNPSTIEDLRQYREKKKENVPNIDSKLHEEVDAQKQLKKERKRKLKKKVEKANRKIISLNKRIERMGNKIESSKGDEANMNLKKRLKNLEEKSNNTHTMLLGYENLLHNKNLEIERLQKMLKVMNEKERMIVKSEEYKRKMRDYEKRLEDLENDIRDKKESIMKSRSSVHHRKREKKEKREEEKPQREKITRENIRKGFNNFTKSRGNLEGEDLSFSIHEVSKNPTTSSDSNENDGVIVFEESNNNNIEDLEDLKDISTHDISIETPKRNPFLSKRDVNDIIKKYTAKYEEENINEDEEDEDLDEEEAEIRRRVHEKLKSWNLDDDVDVNNVSDISTKTVDLQQYDSD